MNSHRVEKVKSDDLRNALRKIGPEPVMHCEEDLPVELRIVAAAGFQVERAERAEAQRDALLVLVGLLGHALGCTANAFGKCNCGLSATLMRCGGSDV